MANKKEFGNGILFTATNYIWWLLLTNIYFLLVNIPFILILIVSSQAGEQGFNLLLVISALPIGPSLAALFSVMGKLVREKDVDVSKDFFKAYKKNFWESLFFGGTIIAMLIVIYIDIVIVKVKLNFPAVNIILLVIGFFIISMAFYIFPLISRFYLRIKDIIKLAFIYSIKKIHITIFNWVILIGLFSLLAKIPAIMFLFMWSIFGYLVMYFENALLKELEEKITEKSADNNLEKI